MNIQSIRQRRVLSSLILLVMALSFAVKAAIPAGFMPETKGGMTAMVICSSMGEKTVMVPTDESVPAQNQDHKAGPCAYFLSATQKILTVNAPALPMADNPLVDADFAAQDSTFVSSTPVSLFARGPPSLV